MPEFGLNLLGERALELRFERFPEQLRKKLKDAIGEITQELQGAVTAAEPNRTGKLRSETRSFVDDRPDFVRGRVVVVARGGGSAEGGKAAALEYGAHGASAVRTHARTIAQVYGRIIAPTEILVGAYERRLDITARRFLRGPLDARKSQIMARLKRAADETAAEG